MKIEPSKPRKAVMSMDTCSVYFCVERSLVMLTNANIILQRYGSFLLIPENRKFLMDLSNNVYGTIRTRNGVKVVAREKLRASKRQTIALGHLWWLMQNKPEIFWAAFNKLPNLGSNPN